MDVAALLDTTPTDEHEAVTALVGRAAGLRPVAGWTLAPVDYAPGSPATGSLHRLRGRDADGRPWSLFCKVLQHVRHWPVLAQLPPPMAAQFVEQFPWRAELALWDPRVQACLPAGMRSPVLHRVVELPDDRAAVWMEDVTEHPDPWDPRRYARAAHLLGRWNARATAPEVLAVGGLPPGFALRMYAERSVPLRGLAPLADDRLWRHPWLAPHDGTADALRRRLRRAGERVAELLDRLDGHQQALPHGDASPQNLLVPADDPDDFVAIDVSFTSPHALGFDLGQLVVGPVHAGLVPAAQLPGVVAVVVPAYLEGLAAEGVRTCERDVRWAFAASALLRSGLDAVPYHLVGSGEPGAEALVAERLALSAFLVDQLDDADRSSRAAQPSGRAS